MKNKTPNYEKPKFHTILLIELEFSHCRRKSWVLLNKSKFVRKGSSSRLQFSFLNRRSDITVVNRVKRELGRLV